MRLGRRAARTENHGRKLPQKNLVAIMRWRGFPRQQVRQVSRARDPAGMRQVFGNIGFRSGHMHADFLDRLSYGQAVCIQDRGRHGMAYGLMSPLIDLEQSYCTGVVPLDLIRTI